MQRRRRYRTIWEAVIGGRSPKAFGPRRTKWSLRRINSKWRHNPKKKRPLCAPRDSRDPLWFPERMVPRCEFYRHYNKKGRTYAPITIWEMRSLPPVIEKIKRRAVITWSLV